MDYFSSQMVSPQYWADTVQCLNPYSDNVDGIWSRGLEGSVRHESTEAEANPVLGGQVALLSLEEVRGNSDIDFMLFYCLYFISFLLSMKYTKPISNSGHISLCPSLATLVISGKYQRKE